MKSFRSNNSKKLLAVLISAIATGGLFGINPASALSPPNINNDISWGTKAGENGIGYTGVADIMAAFNYARRQEEVQLGLTVNALGNLVLPSQSVWDGMSDDAKALFLLNAERTARAGMMLGVIGLPLAGIENHVDTTAQNYATLLHNSDTTGHYQPSGNSTTDNPTKRIDATVGASCKEFTTRSENLAYFAAYSTVAIGATSVPLPIERAIYAWIYDDASSSWGHREAVLLQDTPLSNPTSTWGFKNNNGAAPHEGFLGFHRIGSTGYTPFGTPPYPYSYGVAVVMNIFDPVSDASAAACGYNVTLRTEDLPSTNTTNTAPVANNDTATTTSGTAVTISNVLANDTDANGDTLSVTANTTPANGTVTRSGNTFIYTPKTGFSGTDSFTYTISDGKGGSATATVNVTVGAAPNPVDAIDDSVTTEFNTVKTFNVVTNDLKPTSGTLSISAYTNPPSTAGTLTLSKTGPTVGEAKFTPKKGYSGTTSFTYTLRHSQGSTDTATVNITVKPGVAPTPVDDTASTKYGTPVTFNVLTNDGTPKPTITKNTIPAKGTVKVNKTTGDVTYTPKKGTSGADTFTYTVTNAAGLSATANVTVNVATNTAPVAKYRGYDVAFGKARTLDKMDQHTSDTDGDAILANSVVRKPTKGIVKISGGKFIYTPNRGALGTDSFTYTVKDIHGAVSNEGYIGINITTTPNPSS